MISGRVPRIVITFMRACFLVDEAVADHEFVGLKQLSNLAQVITLSAELYSSERPGDSFRSRSSGSIA